MDILNKFDNVEINQFDTLSENDKEFCEKIQSQYEKTLAIYKQLDEIYQQARNKETKLEGVSHYSGLYLDSLDIIKKTKDLNKSLVSEIYYHFSNTYNIKINQKSLSYEKSYQNFNAVAEIPTLNYKTFVDDILGQLGGQSFNDLRIQQLKEEIKRCCFNSYKQTWRLEIKANTIKFSDLLYWRQKWSNKYSTDGNGIFKTMKSALGWFESGKECNFWQLTMFDKYETEWHEIYETTDIDSEKIKSIKFFKNGRLDIKFQSPSLAREFASSWCGYTAVAEKGA